MPNLTHSLQGHDLGHLHVIAELWGVAFDAPDAKTGIPRLADLLLDNDLVLETVDLLPEDTRDALTSLQKAGGRLPWAQFTRRYGELREMGPGRRDRKQPHRSPVSPVEALWYRALVGRAFFEAPDGLIEFAFIPDDLLAALPLIKPPISAPLGRPATPAERTHTLPVADTILDHAAILLAALRLDLPDAMFQAAWGAAGIPREDLKGMLTAAGILDDGEDPDPEQVRTFLEAGRAAALLRLFQAWRDSTAYCDLLHLPHLEATVEMAYDPRQVRETVIGFLAAIPRDTWWSLPAFVAAVKQTTPDYQRPAGDYDSWYLQHRESGEFYRGFKYWDVVDGELLRYLITGPLYWLGVMELAAPGEGAAAEAFHFSPWAEALLGGKEPGGFPAEEEPLHVTAAGVIRAPHLTPRTALYQVSRFCDWDTPKAGAYRFRLTPAGLARAQGQGLKISHLLALLRSHASSSVPPNLIQALGGWDQYGTQARLSSGVVLRLKSPELLVKLRASGADRFLGDPLGPTAILVNPGAETKVLEALLEMGILGEFNAPPEHRIT